jgi:hypothetical protein
MKAYILLVDKLLVAMLLNGEIFQLLYQNRSLIIIPIILGVFIIYSLLSYSCVQSRKSIRDQYYQYCDDRPCI